jgi:hypothetical protein
MMHQGSRMKKLEQRMLHDKSQEGEQHKSEIELEIKRESDKHCPA